MNIFKVLFLIGVGAFFVACGNTVPTKTNSSATALAASWFNQGQTAWEAWESSNDLNDLQEANSWYNKAYSQDPDKASYQHANYLSSIYLGFYSETIREQDLLPLFKQLDPQVQAEVPPPARMMYAIGNFKQQDPETLIPLVQRAINQKPDDALSWKQLSEQYLRLQQYQLAAAAAHKAVKLDESSGEYAWQLGTSLAQVANNQGCEASTSENPFLSEERLRSAYFTAKGAALQKDKATWYADSAQRYIELGLLPLAQHQINKSRELEINADNIAVYVRASLLSEIPFQSENFVREAENTEHTFESFKALAMASAANGVWQHAEEFMSMAGQQARFDTYDLVIYQWLGQLAQTSSSAEAKLRLKSALSEEERSLREFLFTDPQGNKQVENNFYRNFDLENNCRNTQGYFYTAMKQWQSGNTESMLQSLNQAADGNNFAAREKVWAVALAAGFKKNGFQ